MEDSKATFHSLFHSFCYRPNAHFETQESDEEVILILRAHPITQILWIINGLILFILLIFANVVFGSHLTLSQQFIINLVVSVLILSYFWFNILSYFFNVGIVTNKRVIDVDFSSVIYREFTEAMMNKVEDITAKSGGYFASVFNFGNVFVQTAGTEENIEYINVPRPAEVVKIINEAI